ncbi:unnamed protein product [Absidia cylindrospora]
MTVMNTKLLLVFVHGFRGSDTSFKDFPNWMKESLQKALGTTVETVVYPSYRTTGDLSVAVRNFSAWLVGQTKGDSNVNIVLLGHSMGGIVGAETILYCKRQSSSNPLRTASIIGLLAYDTPFYSVNDGFISSTASSLVETIDRFLPSSSSSTAAAATATTAATVTSRAVTKQQQPATTKSSSSGSKWGLFAGTVGVLGVAAVGAYLARDKITSTASDAYDHLEFVSALMDHGQCHKRMTTILEMPDVFVRCFYIQIPPSGGHGQPRTFIALPPDDTMHAFIPVVTTAESEVAAHTSIFDPRKNDYYYTLGSDSISLIAEMVARHDRIQQQKADIARTVASSSSIKTANPTSSSTATPPMDLDLD